MRVQTPLHRGRLPTSSYTLLRILREFVGLKKKKKNKNCCFMLARYFSPNYMSTQRQLSY
jgi:hypothetical protein